MKKVDAYSLNDGCKDYSTELNSSEFKQPSERAVKSILDFSKAYEAEKSNATGHVAYLLN